MKYMLNSLNFQLFQWLYIYMWGSCWLLPANKMSTLWLRTLRLFLIHAIWVEKRAERSNQKYIRYSIIPNPIIFFQAKKKACLQAFQKDSPNSSMSSKKHLLPPNTTFFPKVHSDLFTFALFTMFGWKKVVWRSKLMKWHCLPFTPPQASSFLLQKRCDKVWCGKLYDKKRFSIYTPSLTYALPQTIRTRILPP